MKDVGLPVSVALHVLVLAGALVALPAAEQFAPVEESLPVEVITPEEFAAITKGEKTAKPADKPQAKADTVAELKLDDNPAETVKRESVTAPPPPQPKAPDPVPEPPKPVAKPAEAKPDKADAKAADAKPTPPKPAAEKPANASDQPNRKFDSSKIAALLSKEAPARTAQSDSQTSATAALGSARGNAPKLSLSQRSAIVGAIMNHVSPCWSPPSFAANAKDLGVLIAVDLNEDGTLATDPEVVKYPASTSGSAAASAAMRAIKRCVTAQSPLKLPPNLYASWREIEINFDPSQMAGG